MGIWTIRWKVRLRVGPQEIVFMWLCLLRRGSRVWSQLQENREELLPESCHAVHCKWMAPGRWAGGDMDIGTCPWPAEDYEGYTKRASTQETLMNIVKDDTCCFRHFWGIVDTPLSQSPETKGIRNHLDVSLYFGFALQWALWSGFFLMRNWL